jgi:hypothetical protein
MATRLHITTEYLEPSATRWDSAYTTLNNTSGDWDSTYTTVNSVSGDWNNSYNTGLFFQNTSSTFITLTGGTIDGTLNIDGNLFVTGTATYINVSDFQVQDPLIYLGIQNPSDLLDTGIISVYRIFNDSVEHRHTGFIRNHQDKKWLLFSNLSACPLSGVGPNPKLNDSSIVIDTLRANIEGNLTTNTTVSGNLNIQGETLVKNSSGYRVAKFESLAGYPLEIYTTDEGLEAGYSATKGSIGNDPDGLKVYYGTNIDGTEWGEVLYLDKNKDGSIARNKLGLGTVATLPSGGFVQKGPIVSSELTVSETGRLLGRVSLPNNIQEISIGGGLAFSGTPTGSMLVIEEDIYSPFNVFTTVQNNSAINWNYQGTDVKQLTAKYENVSTAVQINSGNWQSAYLTVSSLSATWSLPSTDLISVANYLSTNNIVMQTVSAINLSGTFFGDGSNLTGLALPGQQNINTVVQSSSANWNSAYTTVQSNSSTTWNYQGTDLKALTGKYEDTSTVVQSNSSDWNEAYNTATTYSNVSGTFATKNFVDNKFLPLSGGTLTGQLTGTTIRLADTIFTGNTVQAISLTGTNLFVEIEVGGGIKKYLQLFDIEQPLTTYFVDFEDGTKGSYASGNVILNGLSWNMTECLIGTLAQDWKNGLRSARLRGFTSSEMSMLQDKQNGIGTITFFYSRYATDSQVQWIVEYSMNGGVTWIPAGTFTADATVQQFTAVIDEPGNSRIRIRHNTGGDGSTNRRTNVDDILITGVVT